LRILIPDFTKTLLIPIPQVVIPDPGVVIPDSTPKKLQIPDPIQTERIEICKQDQNQKVNVFFVFWCANVSPQNVTDLDAGLENN